MRLWVVAALALCAVVACDADTTGVSDSVDDVQTADEVAEDMDLPSAVCACETDECVDEYVRDHLGCDICVTWSCGDRTLHKCAMCDGDGDGDGEPVDLASSSSTPSHDDLAR